MVVVQDLCGNTTREETRDERDELVAQCCVK